MPHFYLAPPIAAVFFLGVFNRRLNAAGGCVACFEAGNAQRHGRIDRQPHDTERKADRQCRETDNAALTHDTHSHRR